MTQPLSAGFGQGLLPPRHRGDRLLDRRSLRLCWRMMNRAAVLAPVWVWLLIFVVAPVADRRRAVVLDRGHGVPPFTPLLHDPDPSNYPPSPPTTTISTPGSRACSSRASPRVACLLIGYPMALAIARAPERWRSGLLLLVMLPFWTGFLLRITAWIGLLRDEGWINLALRRDRPAARSSCSTPTSRCMSASPTPTCRS